MRMTYVALLRGVNVGGNSKVSMAQLKTIFEELGYGKVKTYINSGNVIFQAAKQKPQALASAIEKEIEREFGFAVTVLIRDLPEIHKLVQAIPDDWVNDTYTKCDVMFLHQSIDKPDVLDELHLTPGLEEAKYFPGAVVWKVDRHLATKSKLFKIVGTPLYKNMTIRNPNTVRKFYDLMKSTES